ncbi:MAG: amidohydrolase family protein [Saprospiraceae bacterium]
MNTKIFCGLLLLMRSPSFIFSQSLLFYNGHVFTSDTQMPFARYFIVKDGKIIETGDTISAERLLQFDHKIDMSGKTIIPGIIDSHIHFIDGSLSLLQISLSGVQDSAGLTEVLNATSNQLIDGFYVARDLGFSALSAIGTPRTFLDNLFPAVPAIIFLRSGHAAISNSIALKKLGFKSNTKIPDGEIGKDKNGKLTGWLLEAAAMEALKRIGAKYSGQTIETAIDKGQKLALSYGITTLGDNTFSPYNMKIYQALQRQRKLNIRMWTRSYGRLPQTTSLMKPMGVKKLGFIGPRNDFSRIHFHLIKLFEDMSLSVPPGMTGSIEPGGTVFLSKKEIKNYLLLHPDDDFAFHVQGEEGLQNILNAINELGKRNNHRRHVIDHAGYCTPEQLAEIHNLGSSVTILASQTFDYLTLIREYGNSNTNLRENELLNARVKYNEVQGALTSDFPYGMDTSFIQYRFVDGLNPFPNMAVNTSGQLPDGTIISGFANKTLSIEEAVKSYTTNGAYVLGEENWLGKIAPGYAADFAILDQDIFNENPEDLYKIKVEQTWTDGQKVYDHEVNSSENTVPVSVKIAPYDFSLSPIFGYDPSVGFIYGAAGFIYPLKVPANYFDVQVMATIPGNLQLQSTFMRYEIVKNANLKIPIVYSNLPEYYFGEGDTTRTDNYFQAFSTRLQTKPELEYRLSTHWKTYLFGDFRSRAENSVKDQNKNETSIQLFPDQKMLGTGIGLVFDTRDNQGSTKQGFYGSVFYEHISASNSSKSSPFGLLWGDFRYFHYLYTSKYVFAAHLSGGMSYGSPGYLFRYTLGGSEKLRGYYTNRFRGNKYYSMQAELRFPIFKRLSGVGFIDEGDVSDGSLNHVLFSYGGGIRFSVNDNIALRLDYGRGKDQEGVFFTFGEAF